jgi:ABC-2 type transport system permease protein
MNSAVPSTINHSPSTFLLLPAWSLWTRDVIRFLRQRNRIVGALATPLVFWILIGSGFNPSFRAQGAAGDVTYLAYFFPGTIVLIMLFTAIFSTISVIEDRREGFLQSVLVAPVSPGAIVLGKFLGGTTLAVAQAVLFCVLAPFAGISFPLHSLLPLLLAFVLVAFSMTGLGFLVAWPMDSTQGFHAIMNIVLMPLWMMSGALFPIPPASGWVSWVAEINPITYGVAAIRSAMSGTGAGISGLPSYPHSIAVTFAFCLATFAASYWLVLARRKVS